MKKYIEVESTDSNAQARIQEWGEFCKTQKVPCIIIYIKNNLAEIACDNWLLAEDGIMPIDKRIELESELRELLDLYPNNGLDFFVSEDRVANQLKPTRLWYTFIHVPVVPAKILALNVFQILFAASQNSQTPSLINHN